jgi:plasmid stabilization system protein ParE
VAKSYAVNVTELARQDIASISYYIFEQSGNPDVAAKWEISLLWKMQQLETYPRRFSSLANRTYRKMLFGRHLVIFRIIESEQKVRVCRVVHGARLLKSIGSIE